VQVGDLVRYRYLNQDVGLIVEESTRPNAYNKLVPIYKVIWHVSAAITGAQLQQWDWMRKSGLEVINGTS
jgi:hypothetical protein